MKKHIQEQVIKDFNRRAEAKKRREEKDRLRREAFEKTVISMRESGLLLREYLRLAHFGFYLACFVFMIAGVTFLFYFMGWVK